MPTNPNKLTKSSSNLNPREMEQQIQQSILANKDMNSKYNQHHINYQQNLSNSYGNMNDNVLKSEILYNY